MIMKFNKSIPIIADTALVFDNATIIGDVKLGECCSVWPCATIRGDVSAIIVGNNTNIQDNAVVHGNVGLDVLIGNNVTIGHGAIVHGCKIGNDCLIGMGSIVLDGAVVEDGAVIAAGCVVPPGKTVPKDHLAVGNPMKIVKELNDDMKKMMKENIDVYVDLAKKFKEEE